MGRFRPATTFLATVGIPHEEGRVETVTALSHVPLRTCIGCRKQDQRAQLLRLALDDDGKPIVDVRATMPGRGAWIHPDLECYALAERKNAFGRALRTSGPLDAAPVKVAMTALINRTVMRTPREQQITAAPTTDCEGG